MITISLNYKLFILFIYSQSQTVIRSTLPRLLQQPCKHAIPPLFHRHRSRDVWTYNSYLDSSGVGNAFQKKKQSVT